MLFPFCLSITLSHDIFETIILKRSINIDFGHCYRCNDIDYYIRKCFTIKRIIFVKINIKEMFANTKKNPLTTLTKNMKKFLKKSKKTKNPINLR